MVELLATSGKFDEMSRLSQMYLNHEIVRSKNVMQLFRDQLRWMVLKRNPELEDALAFEEFLSEVVEECKKYRSSMLIYRYYAQKPYDV